MSEEAIHRKVKEQIAHALQDAPRVADMEIEHRFGRVQADVSFARSSK